MLVQELEGRVLESLVGTWYPFSQPSLWGTSGPQGSATGGGYAPLRMDAAILAVMSFATRRCGPKRIDQIQASGRLRAGLGSLSPPDYFRRMLLIILGSQFAYLMKQFTMV